MIHGSFPSTHYENEEPIICIQDSQYAVEENSNKKNISGGEAVQAP